MTPALGECPECGTPTTTYLCGACRAHFGED